MSELKPCAHCGGGPELRWRYRKPGEDVCYWVNCPICGMNTRAFGSEAEAIAAWNTRAERTCHVLGFDDGVDENLAGEWFSYGPPTWYLSCGHEHHGLDCPNYCHVCGARVTDEEDK